MGKSYAHMYTTTRQVSQGREYSCNTEDIMDDDNDNHMFQRPMLFRQTNYPDTNDMFTQPNIIDDELMEKYFAQKTQDIDDSIDATIGYNDICDNDDDDDIMNHSVTLTQDTVGYSSTRLNNIIDFIRNQDV
jgi:hypothetical protein